MNPTNSFHSQPVASGKRRTSPARFTIAAITTSAAMTTLMLLAPTAARAVGFDQLRNLNGPQDAAADAIQGRDNAAGVRPIIDPNAPGAGLCQNIAGLANPSPGASQLGQRCAELVETADPGAIDPDLNIGAAASVPDWLQQAMPEETQIIGSGSTDTAHDQLENVNSRLQVLRLGSSTLPIAGLHLSTGGAASADEHTRIGLFINGDFGTGEKDATFNENAFEFDSYGLTTGVDYRFSDSFVAGVALGYTQSDAEVQNNSASYDSDGRSVTGYGSWYTERLYLEGSLNYGQFEHDGKRRIAYGDPGSRIERGTNSSTDSEQLGWSLAVGYNSAIERFSYGVFVRGEGVNSDIDAYDEEGSGNPDAIGNNEWAMHIEDQEVESLQAALGGQLALAWNLNFGVLQPYFGVEWRHEFEDDAREITAFYRNDPFFAVGDRRFAVVFTTDDADKDYYLVSLGTTLVVKGGTQFFINYDTLLELEDVDSHYLTAGIRFEL